MFMLNFGEQYTPVTPSLMIAERYAIEGEVGQGGFGVVYKARDTRERNRLVAIKQINLQALTPREIIDATASYNREVTLLSKLEHANLPRIYEHFSDAEHWYLVMQFISGETLEDYYHKNPGKHLSIKEALDICIQLCSVLEYLHRHDPPIVFRDVKPANVMRTPTGHLYLIDFGIARYFKPKQARDTDLLGSPGYAAPEQYGRGQSTPQTDIYGLGATLQTLLLGEAAENGDTHGMIALPRELRYLLEQMLEMQASKRPRSVTEVKTILQGIKSGVVHSILKGVGAYIIGILLVLLAYFLMALFLFVPGLNMLLLFLVGGFWWLVLGIQALIALTLLCTRRRRMIGLGVLTFPVFAVILWIQSNSWLFHIKF